MARGPDPAGRSRVRLRHLHGWDVSPQAARTLQQELRDQVSLRDEIDLAAVRLVAGVDNGYVRTAEGTVGWAAVVVLSFPALEVVEQRIASAPATFPYVPGLLSFREAPAVLAALALVDAEPDVLLFDAQGIAHPRRLGLASHLGLFVDRPSIGCAKSRLTGQYDEPIREVGARSPLLDRDELIGAVLRTRPSAPPLFVSPGHKISIESSVALVLACTREGRRLPDPTRLAHDLVGGTTSAHRAGMAKKTPNHQHKRDEPAQNTQAPFKSGDAPAEGPSGQAMQEQDPKRRIGQHTGAGEPPLMKK